MKQTNKEDSEWVFIVLHSETLYFQILTEDEQWKPRPRKPRWVRVLLKVIRTGSKLYGLTV